MLDIQELDDIIYQQLRRHDMAQCARVCKKWHLVAISYLWSDLTCLEESGSHKQRLSFCKVILEDYTREQQRYKLQDEECTMEKAIQDQPSPSLSALSKYGSQIRMLPSPMTLRHVFPSHESLLHLFDLCSSDVQVEVLRIRFEDLDLLPDSPWKSILDFTLPRLRHLNVNMSFGPRSPGITSLMGLLDQCSSILESLKLKLDLRIKYDDNMDEQTQDEPHRWTSLKELVLHECTDITDRRAFWSWLFKRCNSVERLKVDKCARIFQGLEKCMLAHMPNLAEINLGCQQGTTFEMTGDVTATLLSSSRNGWKTMRFGHETAFGIAAMDALANNFSTLEVLDIDWCIAFSDNGIVRVFRFCTNLHTVSITGPRNSRWVTRSGIDGKVFIDQDPDTGSLIPWKCERSLRVLKIMINGIPRPDLSGYNVISEAYPGQGWEIQGRVYDRLARLTNLELLWIGDGAYSDRQSLEMSLESGLDKLCELKSLKELIVMGRALRFGVKEAQWMTEHWPKLRKLESYWHDKEALEWLHENYPEIQLTKGGTEYIRWL